MSNLYKYKPGTLIDEFGVDHSGFNLRDEIEYNTMRADERDNLRQRQENAKAFNNRSPNLDGVWSAAASGFVEGVVGGAERLVNNITGGKYGEFVDNLTYDSYTNRQNKLQDRANQAGVGYINKLANSAIDLGGSGLGYYYGGKLIGKLLK
jgi:hypothetical protein